MATRMQQRRDTAANWTSNNPILLSGEIGLETDTRKIKIGDGSTAWNSLAYFSYGGNVTVVTDTYNILKTDETVICNKSSPFTVTLPTAVVGMVFNIKNIGTGAVTVEGAGSDTIDGELNQPVNQWNNLKVICYAANTWAII